MASEAKLPCGCWAEWSGVQWRIVATSSECDHRQSDPVDGAPPHAEITRLRTALWKIARQEARPTSSNAADALEQRRIWETRCPALLAERDRLRAALEELLDVAERIRGGDPNLDPEQWYATRDFARIVLRDAS